MTRAAWDGWHSRGEVESTSPEALLHLHEVVISPGMVFLDVGVGVGAMAKAAVEWGAVVDALDVSEVAGQQLSGVVRRFYLAAEIEELPTEEYDLALSHLVAQHMLDQELRQQSEHIYRALRPGGVFTIQFAGSDQGAADRLLPSTDCVGHMVRSPDEAFQCLHHRPGEARLIRDPERWADTNTGIATYYYYIHVTKGQE